MKVQKFLFVVIPLFETFLRKDFTFFLRKTQVSLSFISCYVFYLGIIVYFVFQSTPSVNGFLEFFSHKGGGFLRTILFFKGACLFAIVKNVFATDWKFWLGPFSFTRIVVSFRSFKKFSSWTSLYFLHVITFRLSLKKCNF